MGRVPGLGADKGVAGQRCALLSRSLACRTCRHWSAILMLTTRQNAISCSATESTTTGASLPCTQTNSSMQGYVQGTSFVSSSKSMRRGLMALAACAVPSRRTRLARPRPVNGHSRLHASYGSPRRCRLRRHQRCRIARLAPRPRTRKVIYPDAESIRGRSVARRIHGDPDVSVSSRERRIHETRKERSA